LPGVRHAPVRFPPWAAAVAAWQGGLMAGRGCQAGRGDPRWSQPFLPRRRCAAPFPCGSLPRLPSPLRWGAWEQPRHGRSVEARAAPPPAPACCRAPGWAGRGSAAEPGARAEALPGRSAVESTPCRALR